MELNAVRPQLQLRDAAVINTWRLTLPQPTTTTATTAATANAKPTKPTATSDAAARRAHAGGDAPNATVLPDGSVMVQAGTTVWVRSGLLVFLISSFVGAGLKKCRVMVAEPLFGVSARLQQQQQLLLLLLLLQRRRRRQLQGVACLPAWSQNVLLRINADGSPADRCQSGRGVVDASSVCRRCRWWW